MPSAFLIWLIYINIAARVSALARWLGSGLIPKYAVFVLMLLLGLSRSVISVAAPRSYLGFFNATAWPSAILEAGAVIEAFWILASHFRRMRGFGWILVSAIGAVSALAALAVGIVRANWTGFLSGAILFSIYTHVGFLIAALLSLAFFRQFRGVPIRPNAVRHIVALSLFFGLFFAGALVGNLSKGTARLLTNSLVALSGILAFGWWSAVMNADGEKLPFASPGEISRAEFEATEAAHEQIQIDLKKASDDAMRKARGRPETSRDDHVEPPDPPEPAA